MDEILTRHKKELKSLEGEKRASLKKAKALKGKKGKEAFESLAKQFEEKLKLLQDKHETEISESGSAVTEEQNALEATNNTVEDADEIERQNKLEKARRKREAKKDKERKRQEELEREAAEAGPSMRQTELEALETQLKPLSLKIVEIPSDGNCLYRAIAAQCDSDYIKIRGLCADILSSKEDEYAPFCEYTDTIATFEQYVDCVRSSSEWGGHLELRAVAEGLKRSIVVYSATQPMLVMDGTDDTNPVLLSYHLHYYSLGEHYNQVMKVDDS